MRCPIYSLADRATKLWRPQVRLCAFLSSSFAICLSAFGVVAGAPARAQSYPSRPIQLVVPFAVGQVTDILARAFGEAMGAELGQPVVVLNREGAGGSLGFAA